MDFERVPMDLAAYERRILAGKCFVCRIVSGDLQDDHKEVVFEDDAHIAFLDRYPTIYGKVLVAPKAHIEHVVRELSHEAFLALLAVVYRVARAVEAVVPSERTYLLSLGSQQANAQVNWHIAPLPQARHSSDSSSALSCSRMASSLGQPRKPLN